MVAVHALNSRLLIKGKQVTRILSRLCLSFEFVHFVEEVRKVLPGVLLLASLEVGVIFAEKVLEDLGPDTILVEFVGLFACRHFFGRHFLG